MNRILCFMVLVISLSPSCMAADTAHESAEKMKEYQEQKTKEISVEAQKKIEVLHQAILKNDRQTIADNICYPFYMNYEGKSKEVDNKTAFLRYYDNAFTQEFRDISSKHDWKPWWHPRGLMILNGSIWAHEDGCAFTICTNKECNTILSNLQDKE